MKFTINKLIAVTAVLILGLCPPLAMGKRVDAPALENNFSENPTFGAEKEGSIVFTQNDHSTPDDEAKTASGSDTTESKPESAPANDDKNKSSKAESKPLKPFVPSEKIPGEQAVDFPVDI
jgi:hypothetical protein